MSVKEKPPAPPRETGADAGTRFEGRLLSRAEYVERIHDCYSGQGMGMATHDVLMRHDAALRAALDSATRALREIADHCRAEAAPTAWRVAAAALAEIEGVKRG